MDLSYVPYKEIQRALAACSNAADRTRLFATLCRINTLYMIQRAGSGHIGSSFSAMDIVAWLYLNELKLPGEPDGEGDIYFSSKGHDAPGLYSVLLGLGRLEFDLIHSLRRAGGLPGHPDRETPGILTNTGSLGMGISKAKGMIIANRLQGRKDNIYVLTGDGELQEGQLWESLPSAVHRKMGELVVIVDHNKIQSDTWVSKVNDLGDLESKFSAFGWHVARCDGNDVNQFASTLASLHQIVDRPKIIIADTVKGCGVSFMEHTAMSDEHGLYKFHSGAPGQDNYSRALAELAATAAGQLQALGAAPLTFANEPEPPRTVPSSPQRLIGAYASALVRQADAREDLVVLDADLMLDCGLIPFKDKYPDRFVECGIAEQDMVSTAGGLALKGRLPIAHSFACFLSTRPNEQIYNNATERSKVVYVGSLVGALPSGPGHSHQSVRDISALSCIPGLTLVEPATEQEVDQVLDFCINRLPGSAYIRLVSIPWDSQVGDIAGELSLGAGRVIRDGDGIAIMAAGLVPVAEAVKAAELLAQHGKSVRVINMPWLNNIDTKWLAGVLDGCTSLYVIDNHYADGGLGSAIALALHNASIANVHLHVLGLDDVPPCGQNDEVLRQLGLDGAAIAARISDSKRSS